MKRILVFPLMILFGLSTAIRSQTAILKLTFTANYNGEHVPLDSISIQNLTQGGDTMLYAPDTVLYVFYWADTNNHINNQSLSFSVRQNIPNPFSDFTTISIDIPDKGSVKLSVRNVTGQEVTSLTQKLDPGTHRFNFSPGFDRFYFLSASFNGITKSIKMISKGSSQPGNASLAYSGPELSNLQNVDIDITEGNALPSGNKFRFTGYAMTPPNDIGSSEIEDTPQSNQNYNFKIFGGIRCPGVPTVTDTDSNIYNTVLIGNQCWMQENLKTTKYSNGSPIPNVTEADAWFKLTTGAYAWQNNDVEWKDHYGALYNWLAIKDTNGICPPGWHVPSYKEWSELTDFLKATYFTNGIMLKSCRQLNSPLGGYCSTTDHPRWSQYSSFNGTDDFAFSGLPGGVRTQEGSFSSVGFSGYWWSSTGYHLSSSIYSFMRSSIGELGVLNESWLAGMAIRCVKDEEVIPPKASFSGSPFGGKVPLTVHFTDLSTNFPNNWYWDFGDGNTSFHKNPTHTYNSPGLYSVKLTVSNAYGTDTGISSNYIHVPANIPCPGMPTVTDIDGNVYLTVLIGNQCWMKENLKTTNYRNGVPIPNETDQENWKNLTTGAYAWYDNDISMKESYGAFYNWYAVIDQNGLCPAGWHLPGHAEWNELIELIGGTETPYAKKLQSCRQVNSLLGGDCNAHENPRWNLNSWRYGTDDYGFSGLPGGYRYQNGFYSIGSTAAWWALTDAYSSEAYSLSLVDDGSITEYPIPKFFGMSVRCLRDENMIEPVPDFTSVYSNIAPPLTVTFFDLSTNNPAAWVWDFGDGNTSALQNPTHTYLMSGVYTVCLTVTNSYGENTVIKNKYIKVKLADNIGAPCPDLPTISDIDGNIYNTVLIGNQCWMKENLKTTTYRNGNSIPEVTTNPHWNSLTTGAFSWYGNNESWKDIYGALYNRYAVIDTNGLCPAGWHVADFDECNDLRDYIVGPESFKGDQLKSCRQIDSPVSEDCDTDEHPRWNQHNTHYGTDDYGFTGLPSGVRSQSGGFASIGSKGSWWSTNGYSWFLSYESGNIAMSSLDHSRTGNSVRCLKDDLIQLPDAKFNGNPVKGISPFSVVFSDQSTNKPSAWHWDFGDGNSSTQQNPLHTFETEGIFTVKLTVTNAYGVSTENKINYVKVYNGTGTGAPCPETPTVTDFDGNVYNTVLIGTQCWMKENLRTTTYRNGLPIQNVTDDDYWSKLIMGAYVWYDNDSTLADKYGALYNWYAVMDPGGLCPDGWHVPSYDEYLSLPDFSPYYSSYFGNRYKSCRQVDSPLGGECNTSEHPRWDQHDIEYGTDEYGFSGLPAGARGYTTFSSLGKTAFYWTSSEYKPNEAITIYWYYNYNRVDMGYRPKKLGYSVRCIRDY